MDEAGDPGLAARRRWMAVLAAAEPGEIEEHWRHLPGKPAEVVWLRPPETGMVMVRGRAGGSGMRFNLGEMTVTRCTVRLAEGPTGTAYVAGTNARHAELAALFDGLLQLPDRRPDIERAVIAPLTASGAARQDQRSRKAAATKVDFFTLVRGS